MSQPRSPTKRELQIFRLSECDGLSFDEIARQLGIQADRVRRIVHRLRKWIAELNRPKRLKRAGSMPRPVEPYYGPF